MNPGWPSAAVACELPRACVHVELGRRRHRRMTLPAGLLLLCCLFLPAVRGCDAVVYPIETPHFWHPYVYGGALALAALASTVRALRIATTAIRLLAYAALAGAAVLSLHSPALGVVEMALGGVLLAIIGGRGVSEKRLAVTGIVMSVLSLLWFGLWAGSAGALVGVYLSFGASIFMLAGSLLWLSEL